MKFPPPRQLELTDDVSEFDCGVDSLNNWLRGFAKKAQKSNALNTFVICQGETNKVIAYYAIKPGDVQPKEAPDSVIKGASRVQPIGIALIARLAVDRNHQNKELGTDLLCHAVLTIYKAIDILGGRAIMVHALNDRAADFYKRHGFEEFPTGEKTLFLTIEEVKASILAATSGNSETA